MLSTKNIAHNLNIQNQKIVLERNSLQETIDLNIRNIRHLPENLFGLFESDMIFVSMSLYVIGNLCTMGTHGENSSKNYET